MTTHHDRTGKTRHSIDPQDTDGGMSAAGIEKEVHGFTAEDFGNAEFARHPKHEWIAIRFSWSSENRASWVNSRGGELTNITMAEKGWVPVHECPDPDAHWRLDEALEHAEKAEGERSLWQSAYKGAAFRRKQAENKRDEARHEVLALRDDLARAEAINNDVSDEMVERGWASISPTLRETLSRHTIRRILETAFTEPTRPEGAEELETVIGLNAGKWTSGAEDVRALADLLASKGVRVTEAGR